MDAAHPERLIFILDDNLIDRETWRRYLTQSPTHQYRFVEHNRLDGALEQVQLHQPECILLDYHLRDGNGMEFLSELVEIGGPMAYPVVMLTGTGSESIAVDVMKTGAQDYLVKDRLAPEILQRSVESAIYKAKTDRLLAEQQKEMQRLYQEAQEANARKDHFLAALSHELRTPLTPVLVAVSSLDAESAGTEELREAFSLIRRNIELEARLIDDLLDLTRISRGKFEMDFHPEDLHGLLKHAAETCQNDIQQKGLELQWQLDAAGAIVQADASRLQQVFWNILKNAVKFTASGGSIQIATRDLDEQQVEVTISDTGIGIQPDQLQSIFNAFEQGSSEITRRFGGLGLGLAISKALVEAHQGSIHAVSDPEKEGATFHVVLKQDTSGRTVGSHTPPPAATPSETPPKQLNILLVEDHADSAFFLGRVLEKRGYRVHIANSAAEAIELFKKIHIDCVVSDIGLPDVNGNQLMETLAAIRPVPGIALSGYGMEEDLQRSQLAGFSHHLTKPVDWQKLRRTLDDVLKSPQS